MPAMSRLPRFLYLFSVVVLFGLLGACTKNEVTLEFSLPRQVNTHCGIIYYASGSNGGMMRETVVEISDGKGKIKLPLGYPSLLYLSSSRSEPDIIVYAERGQVIKVEGDGTDMAGWRVSGNRTTEAVDAWRVANLALIKERSSNPRRINKAVAAYVASNADSPAAAIILYCYFFRRGFEKEFYRLQGVLGRRVIDDEKLMSALSAADLMTRMPDVTEIPRLIMLTDETGYADTLRLADGTKRLLMFLGGSRVSNGFSMDSVKMIAKRDGREVVELYLETDSLNWRRHVEADTVAGLRRLWLPLGLADSLSIRMGVRRVPYFIVVNPEGKELYRGDDWAAARRRLAAPERKHNQP